MTEVILAKYKVIPNKKEIWTDWCRELQDRKEEVIETLNEEGVISESCFISKDGSEVFIFMEAKDMEKAFEMGKNSTHQVDKDHKKKRKMSLEFVEILDNLFHFPNHD